MADINDFKKNGYLDQYNKLKSLNDNYDLISGDFTKLIKLLSECGVGTDASIESTLSNISTLIKGGSEFSSFIKNPNNVFCFATALIGLAELAGSISEDISSEIESYYSGLVPYVADIFRGLIEENTPGPIEEAVLNSFLSVVYTLMDIGAGFAVGAGEHAINEIEDKVYKSVQVMGKFMAFMFVASAEFRYMMTSIFIENVKTQTQNRINYLSKLRAALSKLIYEIDNFNSEEFDYNRRISLDNYRAALQILEDTVPINEKIEKDLIEIEEVKKALSENVLSNFDIAKKLLVSERNRFLELLLESDVINVDLSLNDYVYLLAYDYSNYSGVKFLWNRGFGANDTNSYLMNFVTGLSKIDDIFLLRNPIFIPNNLTVSTDISEYKYNNPGPNSIWLKLSSKVTAEVNDVVIIENMVFVINAIDYRGNDSEIMFINISPYLTNYFDVKPFSVLNQKKIKFYKRITYTEESRKVKFILSNDSYSIVQNYPETNVNTIVINKDSGQIINNEWGGDTGYDLLLFLKYTKEEGTRAASTDAYKVVSISGNYPNFVEQQKNSDSTPFQELPEPYRTIYNEIKQVGGVGKLNLRGGLNIGGELSRFLFGKDIINDPIRDLLGGSFKYDKFIQTSTDVLQAFCPLKNSLLFYYSLLRSVSNYENVLEDTSFLVNKNWTIYLNRVVIDTLKSMTLRDVDNEFVTINQIKESPLYSKLIPSVILDYDNIVNAENIFQFMLELSKSLEINSELADRFDSLQDIIDYLNSGQLDRLQSTEAQLWSTLSSTLINSIDLMIKGERVSSLQPVFDQISSQILDLITQLSDLYGLVNQFTPPGQFGSQNKFLDLLDNIGLSHWKNIIKRGEVDKFIKEDATAWAGKWGPTITCLNQIVNKFTGNDKLLIEKIIRYLSYIDFAELLTSFELGNLDLGHSINLNMIREIPESTKIFLKTKVNRLALVEKARSVITNKMNK